MLMRPDYGYATADSHIDIIFLNPFINYNVLIINRRFCKEPAGQTLPL